MFCARCGHVFTRKEEWTWTVLPRGTQQVPTCRDDRLCESYKPQGRRNRRKHTARMKRVRALAIRYIAKGVSA
ncbi:MAG: hypothetical protein K0R55_3593 [Sporomusa sp.]|nr:hypothetical protein [Sporomusa sp.]